MEGKSRQEGDREGRGESGYKDRRGRWLKEREKGKDISRGSKKEKGGAWELIGTGDRWTI